MTRPDKRCSEVIEYVADKLVDKINVVKPLQEGEFRDDFVSQLVEVLDDCLDWNGFQLGKELDNDFGWDIDTDIVNILDNATTYQFNKHDAMVRDWVAQNHIQPEFRVGDKVRCQEGSPRFPRYSEGTIVNIRAATAEYIVAIPERIALLNAANPGVTTIGTVTPYERCELIKTS